MRCPFCKVDNDKVIDSRSCQDDFSIRRRRECLACGMRFTTYETIEEIHLKVIKKNGARVPFMREKIVAGLHKACEKRPIAVDQIEKIVDQIVEKIMRRYEKEVPTAIIGEFVMEALKNLDQIAYIRFASVYRNFQDLHEFMNEIEQHIPSE